MCLGKTLADVQMMVLLARLLHRLDLRLESDRLARRGTPVPGPAPSFKVRVGARRT